MSSPTPDWTAVVERLEKLEKQNRRLKQAGAVALILAAAVLLMGQASPNRTVEANRFVLTDRSGNEQGVLMLKPSGPSFMLLDPNSLATAELSIRGHNPDLILLDANGKVRFTLNAGLDGAELALSPGDARIQAGTLLSETSLQVSDKEGFQATFGTTDLVTPRTGETHKTSAASVVLFDKDGTVLWKAP